MDTTDLKTRMNTKVQALSEREPDTSQYLALTSNVLELIQENLKHQPLSFQLFDMVKSPSGGSTVFSVPGLSGEEAEKESRKRSEEAGVRFLSVDKTAFAEKLRPLYDSQPEAVRKLVREIREVK